MRSNSLALAGLLVFQTVVASAVTAPLPGTGSDDPLLGHYDIRILGKAELDRVVAAYEGPTVRKAAGATRAVAEPMRQGAALLRTAVPGARVELSPVGSGVEAVSAGGAPLSAPAPGQDGRHIVRSFLRDHAAVWGLSPEQVEHLDLHAESTSGGTRTVTLRQTVHGRPVFQSDTRALLDADGRLLQVVGRLVPGIDESAVPETMDLSPAEALQSAMRSVGVAFDPARVRKTRTLAGAREEVDIESPVITRPVTSEAVYFPLRPGVVVPAWAQVTFTRGPSDWYTVVDARTGTVLWRKDIRYHVTPSACFQVYVDASSHSLPYPTPLDSPTPASPNNFSPGSGQQGAFKASSHVEVLFNSDVPGDGRGWLDQRDDHENLVLGFVTHGNNVDAYLDRDANDIADGVCLDPGASDPTNLSACLFPAGRAVAQKPLNCGGRAFEGNAFEFHPAGDPSSCASNEPSKTNYNYHRGALTQLFYLVNWFHDRLYQLGFDEKAGNFQTANPDPTVGLGQDPIFAEAQYGADAGIFNLASFSSPPDGSPGILRLSLWNGPTPNRDASLDAEVVFHELAHGVTSRMICNGAGLNWFPGRALAEGWSDFYALALLNPDGAADGRYSFGSYTAYKLGGHNFTDNYIYGMRRYPYATKMTASGAVRSPVINPLTWADTDDTTDCFTNSGNPCNPTPSKLGWEALGANEIHNVGELWATSLWEVRAGIINVTKQTNSDCHDDHGKALDGNDLTLRLVTNGLLKMRSSCDPSFLDAREGLLAAVSETVEYYAAGTATVNDCKEKVVNAIWSAFAKWGFGSDACDSGGIATHYGIRPGQSETNPPGLVCPTPQPPPSPASLGSPTTYDSTVSTSDATIPDGDPRGKVFTMVVSDDNVIGNLQLKLNLTHPWVGDLTVMLKGPSGYGTDLVYRLANNPTQNDNDKGNAPIAPVSVLGLNRGSNFGTQPNNPADTTNTVIADGGKNLLTAGRDDQPFDQGTWAPVLTSPDWFTSVKGGQLSPFIGKSTKGIWTLFISDVVSGSAGNLVSWSLVITPKPPALAPIAGTQKALSDFKAGHMVTYKLVLTNPGKGDLHDGPGPEFREFLPPELALVGKSVRANVGRVSVEGNSVVWNGSLPPGGTVQFAFDARVRRGTAGKTVSSQGRLRYEDGGKGMAEAVTDDPATPERGDANRFVIAPPNR